MIDPPKLHDSDALAGQECMNQWSMGPLVLLNFALSETMEKKAIKCCSFIIGPPKLHDSDAPKGHDRMVVNKDNASTGGLQAGPQRISGF
jgi:hypothetical protein